MQPHSALWRNRCISAKLRDMANLVPTLSPSPLLSKILEKKGLIDPGAIQAYLTPQLSSLFDPLLMKGMSAAVGRIRNAVLTQELILIHGDYDVDGVTGTAIMARLLEKLGAKYTTFLPDRERDGYGVSSRAIREGAAAGVKILVTVDCGVAATQQVSLARELGLDVIVIDHHRIPAEGIPSANIILNPLQEDCPYPFKELSAAGLAFKLAQAFLGDEAFEFLDLAAISAIGDVVPLQSENRVIVRKGLEVIASQKKAGIAALLAVSKMRTPQISVSQVAFQLSPRINAAGRMGSPDAALRLLLTDSLKEASSLASILESENEARKLTERRCTQEAIAWVERTANFKRDKVLVAASEKWHVGVIGIVAARLVEKFHRPSIVIGFQNGVGKGSGRSIPGFNLFYALQYSKETLLASGGHAQAAGLSIEPTQVDAFRTKINEYAVENFDAKHLLKHIDADLEIQLNQLSEPLLAELEWLEPHGAGNPQPRFLSRNLKMISNPRKSPIGVYEVVVSDGHDRGMMHFKEDDYLKLIGLSKEATFEAVYEVRKKSWNGVDSIYLAARQVDLPS